MNKRIPLTLAAVAIAATLGISEPAHAQWLVIDPANLAQTFVTALRSIKAEADRAIQIKTQLDQYREMIRNAKRLENVGTLIKDAVKEQTGINEYAKTLNTMYGDVQSVQKMFEQRHGDRVAQYKNGARNFAAELQSAYKTVDDRKRALEQEIVLTQRITDNQEKIKSLQREIPSLDTAQKSSESINAHLNLVATQINELLVYTMSLNQATNNKRESADARNQAELENAQKKHDEILQNIDKPVEFKVPDVKYVPK